MVAESAALIKSSKPVYPSAARRAGVEGRVLLEILVGSSGRVESVRVAESSGHQSLDQSALRSVSRWRFRPAKNSRGNPVSQKVRIPIDFLLDN